MPQNLTTPITGAAQTGFTSPTYTHVADMAAGANMKQVAVSAVGGAGNTPTLHSASSPFTINLVRPLNFQVLGPVGSNGRLSSVPLNVYKVHTRKGVVPLSGQPAVPAYMKTEYGIPAGSDLVSPIDLRAMISAHIGALNQLSAEIGNTAVTGTM